MNKLGSFFLALGVAALVGCSSAPKTPDQLATNSRDAYIQDVHETLDKWDNRAEKVKGDRSADLHASISDARAELRAMEAAPSTDWQAYQTRINSRLNHIQQVYNQAKAE